MPRKGWIDKSKSTTYALVHRPQNDPQLHDASSSSMVFQELAPTQAHKIKSRNDLETELFGGSSVGGDENLHLRDNEGEAAEYGIFYDDTEYDYMQHMRDLNSGDGSGESYFVEAPARKQKGKDKISLEDTLQEVKLEDAKNKAAANETASYLLDDSVLPSKNLNRTSYQDQQDIPDALAGFQPDMDPRLREVLEALEDEDYVDDEEDVFGELVKDREEVSLAEFEELGLDEGDTEDDPGWETDDTAKPSKEYKDQPRDMPSAPSTNGMPINEGPDNGDGDWMAEFSKFKKATKVAKKDKPVAPSNAELQSSIMNGSSLAGRKKKRKGAMTSSTGYSMTSSSLFRTEGLTTLDARFDKIEEEYAEDDGMEENDDDGAASVMTGRMSTISRSSNMSKMSNLSGLSTTSSQAPNLIMRSDFDGIMDEFLGGYSMSGKKRVKKGGYQSGLEQLDEIRRELGPPRIAVQKAGR